MCGFLPRTAFRIPNTVLTESLLLYMFHTHAGLRFHLGVSFDVLITDKYRGEWESKFWGMRVMSFKTLLSDLPNLLPFHKSNNHLHI